MALPLILGATAALGSVFNLVEGIGQKKKARKALAQYNNIQNERPEFQTPEEAMQILSMAYQDAASNNMPGLEVATDRNTQNLNNVIAASAQGGNPFATLVGAQAQANAGNQDLATASASFQDQQQEQLKAALQMIGGYKDMEFQMNEFAPWADKSQFALNEFRDNRQAGNQNVSSGLNGLSTIAMSMLSPGLGGSASGASPNMAGLQSIFSKYTAQPTNTLPAPY